MDGSSRCSVGVGREHGLVPTGMETPRHQLLQPIITITRIFHE